MVIRIKRIISILFLRENKLLPVLFLVLAINASCGSDDILDTPFDYGIDCTIITKDQYKADPNDTTSVCIDWNHPALEEMRKRAKTIGNIKWTPKEVVPNNNGFFSKGVEVTGIPYSSVKEKDKFIGQEVSFYTFLSAVNNPRSVLYTENVRKAPYQGINCAAYYGTVCSGAVNYALGLDRPYSSKMYGALPFIKRIAQQDLDHAAPGDIVYFTYGHVILITDIIKQEDGTINYVDILESTPNVTFNRRYSVQELQERLDNANHMIYRYENLEKLATDPSPFPCIEANFDTEMNNDALSLSRGDRVSYSEETIVVNVLDRRYDMLDVFQVVDDSCVKVKEFYVDATPDLELDGLAHGSYIALLAKNDGTVSKPVFFEILQTEVKVSVHRNIIDVSFYSDNAIPEYIVFCKENGNRAFISDITDEERLSGHKLFKSEVSMASLFIKVFFRGEYGRVSNPITLLQ